MPLFVSKTPAAPSSVPPPSGLLGSSSSPFGLPPGLIDPSVLGGLGLGGGGMPNMADMQRQVRRT